MSLSPPDQRILDSIEAHLAVGAPELAARLATFARLASGDEMPAWESLPAGARHRYVAGTHLGQQRSLLLLWLAVTFGLIAVALILNHGGHGGEWSASWPLIRIWPLR
jgi:hypothetical protein